MGRYNNDRREDRRDDRRRDSHHGYQDRGRKRKHSLSAGRDDSSSIGVGATLAHLQQPELPRFSLTSTSRRSPEQAHEEERDESKDQEGWETVERPSKKQKKIPKQTSSNYPAITFSSSSRLQSKIRISDLQGLVLYLLADGPAPQWISVKHRPQIRKVVVLMVPGLEESDFRQETKSKSGTDEEAAKSITHNESSPDAYYPVELSAERLPVQLQYFAEMFEYLWPVRTPGDDKFGRMHSPLHAMLSAPLPKAQEDRGKGVSSAREPQGWKNLRTPITEYISSADELAENEYVLHPAVHSTSEEKEALLEARKIAETSIQHGWVDTDVVRYEDGSPADKDIEAGSITAGREVFAMDCEMVKTGENEFSLTRISIVNWDGTVVMDELVKPDKPITDYLTMYSGMTKEMLDPVTTTLKDIQEKLVKLLHPKTIIIGHSLNADLTALKLTHPFIIDTTLLFPHPRGPPLKSSLKYLAQKYLGKEIQKGHGSSGPGAGHDSIEDSRTCLDLVKQKCEKGPQWGTSEAIHENLFKRLARTGVRYKNQGGSAIPSHVTGKTTAAIDWGNPKLGAGKAADHIIGCQSDEEVADGVIRAVKGDSDGLEIPGGGVEFVWGRMRELEALRGWWNNNKVVEAEASRLSEAIPAEIPEAAAVEAELNTSDVSMTQTSVIESDAAKSGDVEGTNKGASLNEAEISLIPVIEDDRSGMHDKDRIASEPSTEEASTFDGSVNPDTVPTIKSTVPQAMYVPPTDINTIPTGDSLSRLSGRIKKIYDALPPCTAFIIYSGSGDPREMSRLQQMQQTFKREFKVKKWDQLSVKWTDTEEQALKKAAKEARNGLGFVTVK